MACYEYNGIKYKEEELRALLSSKPTKVRRILELQSDLFQKGRDKEFLVDNYKHTPGDRNFNVTYEGKEYKVGTVGGMQRVVIYKTLEGQVHYENPKQDWLTQEEIPQGLKDIVSNKFNSLKQEVLTQNKSNKENQFLQLLNKDNNWVTFFVKSIIQDSAKKGYEKVLFPKLDTIIQIESAGKFKTYEEAEKHYKNEKWYEEDTKLRKVLDAALNKPKEEQNLEHILRLKEQIAANQPKLLNTAKFYENTVTNILNKTYGKVQDYSNTPVKSGVDNLFEENKELAKIGNKQLYSAYLNTIFPDSKVKDIVYRGGNITKEEFENSEHTPTDYMDLGHGLYLSPNIKFAQYYGNPRALIVNIEKPKDLTIAQKERVEYGQSGKYGIPKLDDNGKFDGIVELVKPFRDSYELVVFESEQIHILGSKQDIEGFKEFVKESSKPKVTQITDEYGNTWNEVEIKPEHLNKILFSKDSTVLKKNNITNKMKDLLLEFCKINGIKVEFVEKVLDDNNNEVNGLYDSVKKVIKINQKLAETDIFPEEISHYITLALGDEHTLVKRFFNLVSKIDYKSVLGQTYIDLYQGDEMLLKHEYLGKLMAKVIANTKTPEELNNEIGFKIWDTVKRILDSFIRLFKPNYNIEQELNNLAKDLSKYVLSEKALEGTDTYLKMFNSKEPVKILNKETREQVIYYEGLLGRLKYELSQLEEGSSKYENLSDKIIKIEASLKETKENNNKQALLNLADSTLDEIEQYIEVLKTLKKTNQPLKGEKIEKTIEVLHVFENLKGVKDRVAHLQQEILEFTQDFTREELKRLTGKTFDDDIFTQVDVDINRAEANFGTLVDVKNYLAKAIGLLIKEAQALIEIKNKKSFSSIQEAINKLKIYQNSKGITGNDIYKIFIQEHKGTLVLTKPYTNEFYNEINDSFNKEDGYLLRRKIASYNPITKEFVPKYDKYINPNYTKIKNTKELNEFYEFFKKRIGEINKVLPQQYKQNEYFIPNVIQKSLWTIMNSEDSIKDKLKESVNHMLEMKDFSDSSYIFDESLDKNRIPVKYLGKLSPELKSKDLGSVLLKYEYFANTYEHMDEILPKVKLFQEIIKKQDFIKSTNKNKSITGEDSNLNTMIEGFIKMQVLQEPKKEEKYAPYIDFMLKYTSLLRIGLNPFNAITNVIIGNIGNLIEAVGGKHFTVKEYVQATKIFSTQNLDSESKLNKLVELFNPLMELDDYENLRKMDVNSLEYKEKIKSLMYSFQRMGEKQMQVSTMIAILLHTKIKTKTGVEISMWDAFDDSGKWNENLTGTKLEDITIFKTTNKIHRINQMIHGRYSAKDAAILQQYSLFRAAFQFKKWIPAAIESRIGGSRYDERLDMNIEGRYRAYAKGFDLYILGLKSFITKVESGKYTETDIYNMRKNLIEAVLILGTILLKFGLDDDKKRKDPSYKFIMGQLNQISGDLTYFYNPKELTDPAKFAIPMLKTTQDMYKVIEYLPSVITGDKFTKGRFKGENKELAAIINITPVVKPVADFARLWNKDPYNKK